MEQPQKFMPKRILKTNEVKTKLEYFRVALHDLNLEFDALLKECADRNSLSQSHVDACFYRCWNLYDTIADVMKSECAYKDQE